MRILFLSDFWTIFLCFLFWPVVQVGAVLLCLIIPDRYFSPVSSFYKTYRIEKQGKIYSRVFKVHLWKKYLPDGGSLFKGKIGKKSLHDFSEKNLRKFLVESCRGELTHWLAIFPFWLSGLFAPAYVVWIMFAYAVAVNLPCIITQRYNRPRILAFLGKKVP